MKLLFDQNLSPDLVKRLAELYPDSSHVYQLGLERSSDREICHYALANGFSIVTKDGGLWRPLHSLGCFSKNYLDQAWKLFD